MASAPPTPPLVTPAPPTNQPADIDDNKVPQDSGDSGRNPGTFEDIHKKTRDVFPNPFEGARLVVNKGLSNHFQINHSLTLSSLQQSCYKFGATYVGTKQISPNEAFPVLLGDIEPSSGNVNANIIHQFTDNIRTKFVTQIQNKKWAISQLANDIRGYNYTATVTIGNPDLMTESGVLVAHYLQNITKNLDMGAEWIYQRSPNVPGGQMGVVSVGGRYVRGPWTFSGNLTLFSLSESSIHGCFHRKLNESLQIAGEIESNQRTKECTATIGYQVDLPQAHLTFRGQIDSNYQVGAVFEKKLPPLPFTFQMSGWANHVKQTFRFGLGLMIG
ncbi:DgyrCDS10651 [Dimorphilus gyrociliatus]|uniref:DgyrCDS10651 n=1 Tax=Dimorphilus gyrociliatus TaxID=2664684 RepID=A0A7I8W294_9ANNE|nr:DgyrCDS10651 [Dimorphilus gyrociliatus]